MNKPKLGLGKGLGALIPKSSEEVGYAVNSTVEIELDLIKSNPDQPRKEFDEEKLRELAETIKEYGVLQPIILQKVKDSYSLITGERRYRAALMAGLKKIPALIKEYDNQQSMEIALVENLQRENLNPIEEATAYKKLIDEYDYLQEELAQKLGKSRSAITNALRLLALDDGVQGFLVEGSLKAGQVRPLLALSSLEEQRKLASKAIDEKLSARQIEKIVRERVKAEKNIKHKIEKGKQTGNEFQLADILLKESEEKLRRFYGTRIRIKSGPREGKVELSFFGEDDLGRLMNLLLKEIP